MISPTTYPDAVTAAPDVHTALFQNEIFRVIAVEVKPGGSAPFHYHPENVYYVQTPARLRFSKPDGSSAVVDLVAGQVNAGSVGAHAVENIGDTTFRAIQVELIKQ